MWRADVDERRAIKNLLCSLFSPDPEGKRGDRDCVWHEKKKKEHQNLSHLNQRKLFWRLNKDKRTTVALWDLSHAESRTFRPFWGQNTGTEKMGHTLWNIWSEIQRQNLWGNLEESYLNHFETCFRDLLQKLGPIQMRWIRRLIINIPMWRADPYCALFGATQCTRLFNRGYALM